MKTQKYIKVVEWDWKDIGLFIGSWFFLVIVGLKIYYFNEIEFESNLEIAYTGFTSFIYLLGFLYFIGYSLYQRKVRYIKE